MNTVDIIKQIIIDDVSILGIYIHAFPDAPGIQERVKFDPIEQAHYSTALELRDEHQVPFWDALMLSFYNRKQFSEKILDNVLNSHAKRTKIFIEREQVLQTSVLDEYASGSINFAWNSQILTTDGKKRHLVLLDFHIPQSPSNQIIVEKVLMLLSLKRGWLLCSGRSYHYIGNSIVSTYSLISIISRCLFFTPIIDKTWIAHQLIDKSCSLRITRKYGFFPVVVNSLQ